MKRKYSGGGSASAKRPKYVVKARPAGTYTSHGVSGGAVKVYGAKASTPYRRANTRTGGFVGRELNFLDLEGTGAVSGLVASMRIDPATQNCLNAMAAGTGPSSREGNNIYMKKIYIQGAVSRQVDTFPDAQHPVKIWLVLDTQTNGATPDSSQIFTTPSGERAAYALNNLQYSTRFRVLKTVIVDPMPIETAGAGYEVAFKLSHEWKEPLRVTFTDPAGDSVDSISDNSLHIFAGEVSAAGPDLAGTAISYVSRLRYYPS